MKYVLPVLSLVLGLGCGSVLAEGNSRSAECLANKVVGAADNSRAIITEVSVSNLEQDCPDMLSDISGQIVVSGNDQIWLWFRVEATESYLNQATAGRRFEVEWSRVGAPPEAADKKVITLSKRSVVRKREAFGEASLNEGYFDWRLRMVKKTFLLGTYEVTLLQGGTKVCLINHQCSITIVVE